MNELKNKDGVPIRVGQVWWHTRESCKLDIRGINAESGKLWVLDEDGDEFEPIVLLNFCRLISCPVLGDMSEWRIVTAEEQAKYPVPSCAQPWGPLPHEGWMDCNGDDEMPLWCEWELWRVPLDFDFEAERVDIAYDEQEKFEAEKERCTCGVIHEGHPRDPCENCGEFAGNPPRTCPDCNKAAKVCECGIQRAFRATIAENAAPDTLELLGEVFDYDTVRDAVNALIKRTEALT
jgi:hypothetical protein